MLFSTVLPQLTEGTGTESMKVDNANHQLSILQIIKKLHKEKMDKLCRLWDAERRIEIESNTC